MKNNSIKSKKEISNSQNEKKIKLSIIVLIYNYAKFEDRGLLDILANQTLKDIEILCVNDGSKDNSMEVLEKYEKKYPNLITAYNKENGGEWSTRNYGLERAKGEYITFVDQDDYPEHDWAEKLYKAAKKNNSDMAVCGFERIDEKTGKVVGKDMIGHGNKTIKITGKDDEPLFVNPAPWNKIYKRELIKDLRFLPFRGFNDMCFYLSMIPRMNKITFVSEVLYHYYLISDSQIHSITIEDVKNVKKYFLEVKKEYENSGKYEEMKYMLDTAAFIHLGISIMYRASYSQNKKTKAMIKEMIKYLDENFSTWRKSPYLKFSYSIRRGIKHLGFSVIAMLYRMNLYMVFINLYKFVVDKMKIDIKW